MTGVSGILSVSFWGVLLSCASAFAQSVVVDGSTATSVVLNGDGSVSVSIAPASSGVSVNHYSRFDVEEPGVQLDNRSVRARTIVTEVTGPAPSQIKGPVEVLGQRAHLLFANPNGITVDGGSFINSGQVVLGAGRLGVRAREIAPGVFQDNMVLTTAAGGAIRIEGAGLSGQMDALHLYAEKIAVNGPVDVLNDNDLSFVRAVAGSTVTEFESSVIPGNLGQDWARVATGTGAGSGGVVFELGAAGGLNGNRVEILVTDAGAGVRIAGKSLARRGTFSLSSRGAIEFDGAQIRAAAGVAIAGQSITSRNSTVAGNTGAIVVKAAGAKGINFSDSHLAAAAVQLQSAGGLHFSGSTEGASEVVATDGAIVASAKGAIIDQGGNWQSAAGVLMTSGQALSFEGSTIVSASNTAMQFSAQAGFSAKDAVFEAGKITIGARRLNFSSLNRVGTVKALAGELSLTATAGDIVNDSTLLQSATGTEMVSAGSYLARSVDADHRAIVFAQAGDIAVTAADDIDNIDSRIIANGNVFLRAGGAVRNSLTLPDGSNEPVVVKNSTSSPIWWSLGLLNHSTSTLSYSYGALGFEGQDAIIVASGGNVDIISQSLESVGGNLTANTAADGQAGGEVQINTDSIALEAVAIGAVSVSRDCDPFCKYSVSGATDGVSLQGGQIWGAGGVDINASNTLTSYGGLIASQGDVNIAAGEARFTGFAVPYVVERPDGLYNFWSSKAGWIYLKDQFGGVIADTGSIRITSEKPIVLDGADLTANDGVVVPGGSTVISDPTVSSPIWGHRIGLVQDLPPVSWE